jgi:hypothetical protein
MCALVAAVPSSLRPPSLTRDAVGPRFTIPRVSKQSKSAAIPASAWNATKSCVRHVRVTSDTSSKAKDSKPPRTNATASTPPRYASSPTPNPRPPQRLPNPGPSTPDPQSTVHQLLATVSNVIRYKPPNARQLPQSAEFRAHRRFVPLGNLNTKPPSALPSAYPLPDRNQKMPSDGPLLQASPPRRTFPRIPAQSR